MARYSNVQTDFSGGLISDYVLGRTDIKRVGNSGRKFKNFFPSLQGPAIYRSGFKYNSTLDVPIDAPVLSIDVILATDVPYRAVFLPERIEIYDSTGVLKTTVATEYSASDVRDLRFSSETGELYITHGRHKPKKLTADITFVSAALQSTEINGEHLQLFSTGGFGIETSFAASEGYSSGFAADSSFFEGSTTPGNWQIDPVAEKMTLSSDFRNIRTTDIVVAQPSHVVLSKAQFDFGTGTLTTDEERLFMFSLVSMPEYDESAPDSEKFTLNNPNISFTAKFVNDGGTNKLQLFDQSRANTVLDEMLLADVDGDLLEAEIKVNVRDSAATTEVVVTLRSITDGTDISHTQTGVPSDFYTALTSSGVKTSYQGGKLSDGGINTLSIHNVFFRNTTTFGTDTKLLLRANAEIQGDDQWTLEDLSFDVEPFLDKQPESNKFNIQQNERYIKIESNTSDFAPIAEDFSSSLFTNLSAADPTRNPGTYTLTNVVAASGTSGIGAIFTIIVDANGACTVTDMSGGNGLYAEGDTITINNDSLGGGGSSNFTFEIASFDGQYTKTWYVEYTVDGDKFLAKAVSKSTTNTYDLENPTNNIVYAEPVVSVLNIEDNAAQLFLLDNEEATTSEDSDALEKDGVPNNKIHLRSDTTIFSGGFTNAWVRVGDDRRNDKVVIGNDRTRIRWVKIKEHRGTEDHPVEFLRGAFDNTKYKAGSVYRIYKGAPATAYMMGPNSDGDQVIVNAVIQNTANTTFAFVSGLKTGNQAGSALVTTAMTVGNLSEQKQFDVVECYNDTDDSVPKVEEFDSGNNTDGNLISPPSSSTLTLTTIANDAFLNSSEDTFSSSDLNRHIFGGMESGNVFMKIVRNVSTRQVIVKLLNAVPRNKRTLDFENAGNFEFVKLGAWYTQNYPRTVAKFEQRRIFGGTYSNPNFIYFSRVDDEASFQPTQNDGEVLDTDAITYALSNRNAGIRWLNAAKDLVVGTTGGIYRIVPNQYQYGISPKTIRMELTEEEPCEQQAETVGSSIFYPDQSGTRLMEYKYDQSLNNSSSNDVSKLIYGIFIDDPIAQVAYQHAPQPRIWTRTVGGKLFCLSFHRQEEFYAWSEQELGSNTENAQVLDISIVHRGSDTKLDQVWIVVQRGERITTELLSEPDVAQTSNYPMLDSYVELVRDSEGNFASLDVSSFFGPTDTVAVIEDDKYVGDQVLANGVVTLTNESLRAGRVVAEKVVLGYRYTGELQMMFPTWDAQNKPAYGADTARIISFKAFFIKSFSYLLGIKDKFEAVTLSTDYGASGGFTGFDKERPVAGSTFGVDNVPTIKHEEPYPLTIASIITKTDLN